MPDLAWNLSVWNKTWPWVKDGDEWDDFARFCGVPYERWKSSLAETFLFANIRPQAQVLEIGPGHGRWSDMVIQRIPKGSLTLVDLSSNCIEFCKKRLAQHPNVRYEVNDGRSLANIVSGSIDFVFSIDTFVHLEEPEVKSYAKELFRVMKRQAMGAIHHPGNPTPEQRQNGARSKLDGKHFREILQAQGFFVVRQVDSWGQSCNLKLTNDVITVFVKP